MVGAGGGGGGGGGSGDQNGPISAYNQVPIVFV